MIQATQLRRGNTILLNGELYHVVEYQHITPGNWRGMVQTKLRKLSTGAIIDHRFRSEDRVERALLDEREMEYLYNDDGDHYFMDTENYEQIHFSEEVLGDAVQYLVSISENFLAEVNLLVVLGIHEIVIAAVFIEIFHLALVQHGSLDAIFRAEPVIDDRSRAQFAQFRL